MSESNHEPMVEEGTCPRCGEKDLFREEADVGVGIIYGPYACQCGWSELWEYDKSNPEQFVNDYRKDQWGGLTPPGGHS